MERKAQVNQAEEVSFVSKAERFIEKNMKALIIGVSAVVLIVFGFFAFKIWISEPRQAKANEAIFAAEQLFTRGEFQAALDGDENTAGFLQVIDKYGSTKAGQRAKYEAGMCYLRLEQFDQAKKYLSSYKGKDELTPVLAKMAIGDAEIGLGNNEAAVKCYNKAAKMDDNYITAPMAYFKAGLVYIEMNDKEKAVKCFQTVKDNYPESSLYSEMDRFIAYAENME